MKYCIGQLLAIQMDEKDPAITFRSLKIESQARFDMYEQKALVFYDKGILLYL